MKTIKYLTLSAVLSSILFTSKSYSQNIPLHKNSLEALESIGEEECARVDTKRINPNSSIIIKKLKDKKFEAYLDTDGDNLCDIIMKGSYDEDSIKITKREEYPSYALPSDMNTIRFYECK